MYVLMTQFSRTVVSYSLPPHGLQLPGSFVHHRLLALAQSHVHRVRDAIRPSNDCGWVQWLQYYWLCNVEVPSCITCEDTHEYVHTLKGRTTDSVLSRMCYHADLPPFILYILVFPLLHNFLKIFL